MGENNIKYDRNRNKEFRHYIRKLQRGHGMSQVEVFKQMLGMVPIKIEIDKSPDCYGDFGDVLEFYMQTGERFKFYHEQDCSESVYIYDIIGDLDDLLNKPLLEAEAVTSSSTPPDIKEPSESYTWTFYKFGNSHNSISVRWLGESNGYYSEEVDFMEVWFDDLWRYSVPYHLHIEHIKIKQKDILIHLTDKQIERAVQTFEFVYPLLDEPNEYLQSLYEMKWKL